MSFKRIKVIAFNSSARVGRTFVKPQKIDLSKQEERHLEQLEYERIVNLGHHNERGL